MAEHYYTDQAHDSRQDLLLPALLGRQTVHARAIGVAGLSQTHVQLEHSLQTRRQAGKFSLL